MAKEHGLRNYRITITGTQPLLFHHDDLQWADEMGRWRESPETAKDSKAGDDRSPAFRWMGCLYRNDDGQIVVPTDNLMKALMQGATSVPVPGAKGNKTFKAQSQSGILPRAFGWPLVMNGHNEPLEWRTILPLRRETVFAKHEEHVGALGFRLYVKRAKIGQSKHVRVRPMFAPGWSATGDLSVIDEQITTRALCDMFDYAGKYKGIGDWRPSSPKSPGTFGMFKAEVTEID